MTTNNVFLQITTHKAREEIGTSSQETGNSITQKVKLSYRELHADENYFLCCHLSLQCIFKHRVMSRACPQTNTLNVFLQLSEPRRLGQQLEEENIFLHQNADHVLRHALQEVMRHHDSTTNEKNGVWF